MVLQPWDSCTAPKKRVHKVFLSILEVCHKRVKVGFALSTFAIFLILTWRLRYNLEKRGRRTNQVEIPAAKQCWGFEEFLHRPCLFFFVVWWFEKNSFFTCYLAAPEPTLRHCQGQSLSFSMLITDLWHSWPVRCQEHCNEAGCLSVPEHPLGFKKGSFRLDWYALSN